MRLPVTAQALQLFRHATSLLTDARDFGRHFMGSGILGGLATGAAVGAGVVAGEALAHRFSDRHQDSGSMSPGVADTTPSADSLGGNDFGIADASSWDDNLGGGGGSDWS